ncbi:MAG TPA: hypothetical protein VHK63_06750 [Candidatus Limnocylindria bacterium]|nr:hypothetical protein [Candidatus Limnocylindria bacterium]
MNGNLTMTRAERLAIERWFVRRGVPQFVEGYGSEAQLDTRAAPLIAGWLVVGTVLFWGVNPTWPPLANLAASGLTIVLIATGFAGSRWLRRREPVTRQPIFDLPEIILLGLLPAVPAGLIDGSVQQLVIAFLNAMLGIGLIYVVIFFGLVELATWAVGRLWSQFAGIIGLLARTLPVLLILVVFLLFAAEIWEAAHALTAVELAAIVGLLVVVGALLVITTFGSELEELEDQTDTAAIVSTVRGTPAEPLLAGVGSDLLPPPPLTWLERVNLHVLVLVNQLLQSAFVGLLVMAFLVAFGVIALPAAVQERWIGDGVSTLVDLHLLGEARRVSAELIAVSAVLGGIVGLYFTGLAITDRTHRRDEFRVTVGEVRQLLAARAVYRTALRSTATQAGRGETLPLGVDS